MFSKRHCGSKNSSIQKFHRFHCIHCVVSFKNYSVMMNLSMHWQSCSHRLKKRNWFSPFCFQVTFGKMKRNYYGVLGIDQNASMQDIKRAYKKLAFEYHPDKNKNIGSEEKFKKIGDAYNVLIDTEKRRIFDQDLKIYNLKCKKCVAIFCKFSELTQHIQEIHPTPYNCTFCYGRFENLDDLFHHMTNFHPFKCNLCKVSFRGMHKWVAIEFSTIFKLEINEVFNFFFLWQLK